MELEEAQDKDKEKKRIAIAAQVEKDRLVAMKARELEARRKRFEIGTPVTFIPVKSSISKIKS